MALSTRCGDYQVDSICVDRFRLDGGAMFGVVPKPLWERACAADEKNRIAMGCQSLVLRHQDRVVLIDAGLGTKLSEKSRAIHALQEESPQGTLMASLETLGLAPEDVTDVIVTHLHFDHAGGLTRFDPEGGGLIPTFPAARHWVQAEHLDWARSPVEQDRGSFPFENIEPLVKSDLFALTRGEEQLFSGVTMLPFHGHTRAMQAVLIDGDPAIFYPADLLPLSAHLHIPYVMAYDIEPLTTLEEKKRMLAQAAREGWMLFLEHEPSETFGRIEMFGGRYRWGTT